MTTTESVASQNPYLEGYLAPVGAEVTATDLEVTGHIPEHLDGRYLRNGPNPAEEVDPATYHWFTGVANYELTEELDTVGTCDFDGTLPGGYAAHPHRDPRTGELHAVSYSFARGRTVQYSVIDTAGRARRTVEIKVSGSPMMHDFSLTDKYVVIYDLPVTFDTMQVLPASMPRWLRLPARLVVQSVIGRVRIPSPIVAMTNRDERRSVGLPYAWNPDYPARIGVMPREGGNKDVRWFEIEPCYVYHPLNAYSETRDGACGAEEVLVLDVVRYSRM